MKAEEIFGIIFACLLIGCLIGLLIGINVAAPTIKENSCIYYQSKIYS